MDSTSLGLIAGTAVTSFLTGGLIAKLLSCKAQKKSQADNFVMHKSLIDLTPINAYITENSLREPEVLRQLRDHTIQNVAGSIMLTNPIESQLFRVLLKAINAKKCIEVGTYTGYNALSMALALPKDGLVYALDVNEEFVNHGAPYFKAANVSDMIEIRIAPAGDTLDRLIADGEAGTFDFIYVDADKTGYETYFEKGLILLRKGGLFAFDNTLQSGRVLNLDGKMDEEDRIAAKAINKFNKMLHVDNRVLISFLNISDGVTFCSKI